MKLSHCALSTLASVWWTSGRILYLTFGWRGQASGKKGAHLQRIEKFAGKYTSGYQPILPQLKGRSALAGTPGGEYICIRSEAATKYPNPISKKDPKTG